MSLQRAVLGQSQAEAQYFNDLKSTCRTCSIIGVIGMIVSIALAIIGIALTATGCVGGGVPLLVLSVPLAYFSYNGYKVSANALDVIDNYKDYENLVSGANTQKIKKRVNEGTICFEYAVDYLVSALTDADDA